jgi:hypothetical protein
MSVNPIKIDLSSIVYVSLLLQKHQEIGEDH